MLCIVRVVLSVCVCDACVRACVRMCVRACVFSAKNLTSEQSHTSGRPTLVRYESLFSTSSSYRAQPTELTARPNSARQTLQFSLASEQTVHELIHLAARAALANHAPRRHRTERWRAATVAFDQRWHWTSCANDGDNVFIRRLVKITLIMGRKARFMMFAESVLICPRRAAVPWQLINYPPLRHTARSAPCRW